MTGLLLKMIVILFRSTIILGIVTALTFFASRSWPAVCSAWKRTGIAGLLLLPFAVLFVPMINIPVLSPTKSVTTHRDFNTTPLTVSRSIPNRHWADETEFDRASPDLDQILAASMVVEHPMSSVMEGTRQRQNSGPAWIAALVGIYFVIASFLLTRLILSWRGLERLRQSGTPISDRETHVLLKKWLLRLQVSRHVRVRVSDEIAVPMTFGWRFPIILIPAECLKFADRNQKEAILLHELMHIVHSDYFWQLLTHLMTATYWVHPLAWLVRRNSDILRERLCDRFCSQQLGCNHYTQALLQIASQSSSLPKRRLGMAMAQRSSLRRRLNDLRSNSEEQQSRFGRIQHALVVGMAAFAVGLVSLSTLTVRDLKSKTNLQQPASDFAENDSKSQIQPIAYHVSGGEEAFPPIEIDDADREVLPLSKLRKQNAQLADEWNSWEDDTEIFNSQVAATINGEPLFYGEILDRYSGYLISVREQMQHFANNPTQLPPGQPLPKIDDYNKFREMLIQRDIATHIQKFALVQAFKKESSPEQIAQAEIHIDELFQKEIEKHKRDLEVTSIGDLERELKLKGTSLKKVRDNFARERLSIEYLVAKCDPATPIGATEISEYYHAHGASFDEPGEATWQTIYTDRSLEINDAAVNLFDTAARKKLDLLRTELDRAGMSDLDSIAQEYSHDISLMKKSYEGTESGSVIDTELEGRLFTVPLNQWSEIVDRPGSFCVIRVTERTQPRRKKLNEVEEEIRAKLTEEQNRNRPRRFLRSLFSAMQIETRFSLPEFVPAL